MSPLNFLNIWNPAVISVLMLFSADSNNYVSLGVVLVIYPLIMSCVFLLLCSFVNFLCDSRHCEFYPVGCWILELSLRYS